MGSLPVGSPCWQGQDQTRSRWMREKGHGELKGHCLSFSALMSPQAAHRPRYRLCLVGSTVMPVSRKNLPPRELRVLVHWGTCTAEPKPKLAWLGCDLCSFSTCTPGSPHLDPLTPVGGGLGTHDHPHGVTGRQGRPRPGSSGHGSWLDWLGAEGQVRTSYHLPPPPRGPGVPEEAQGLSRAPAGG